MNALEKVFIKGKSFARQFELQTRLSDSHKQLNLEAYNKVLNEFDDAITELIKEKILLLSEEIKIEDEESIKDITIEEEPQDDEENKNEDEKDYNSYFKVNVVGGVEIHNTTLETDQYIAINRDICKNDPTISSLLKKKQLIRCRKSSCKNVKDLNYLYSETVVDKM